MRVLDNQSGGTLQVYTGYGLGKKIRRASKHAARHASKVSQGVAKDVGKQALSDTLTGNQSDYTKLAKQSAAKRGQNEIRPYI